MQKIEGQEFRMALDKGNAHFHDLHLHDCAFDESDRPAVLLTASMCAPKKRRDEELGAIAELRTLGFLED